MFLTFYNVLLTIFLSILLIFTLVWSYRVLFLFKKGFNSLFEGCRSWRSKIFRYGGGSFFHFRSHTKQKKILSTIFETLVMLVKPRTEFSSQSLPLF